MREVDAVDEVDEADGSSSRLDPARSAGCPSGLILALDQKKKSVQLAAPLSVVDAAHPLHSHSGQFTIRCTVDIPVRTACACSALPHSYIHGSHILTLLVPEHLIVLPNASNHRPTSTQRLSTRVATQSIRTARQSRHSTNPLAFNQFAGACPIFPPTKQFVLIAAIS